MFQIRPTVPVASLVLACAILAVAPFGRSIAVAQTPAAPAKPAESTAPVRTETIVYDNWVVTCRDRVEKSSKRVCSASMQITDSKSKRVILVWQIGQDPAGVPTYLVRTPLGVRLKDGVQITAEGGKPRKVDYAACDQRGCEAVGPFEDAFGKELSGAREATATFMLANGNTVNVKLPLTGIAKALPALRR
jgi:invasion protein IalB